MPGTWRWLAVVAVAFPQAGFAASGASPVLQLHDGPAALRISGGGADGAGVKAEADLSLAVAGLTTTVSGTAHTANQDADSHGSAGVRVASAWQRGSTKLQLKASQTVESTVHDGVVAGALYSARVEQQSGTQTASAAASFAPLPSVTVETGVEAQATSTAQRQALAGVAPATSQVETRQQRDYAKASWAALPRVDVKAEVATATTDMTMHGSVDGQTTYRTVEPSMAVTAKPWDGGTLTLGIARAVQPLNAANLAAYAAATGKPTDASLQPDSARAVTASVTQTIGDLSLSATYKNSELLSTTVLVPAASGQTPSSIAGGRRQSFSAAMTLSLAALGLPKTTLTSKAEWRRSRIRDPLTGQARRVSGEVPHEARFQLAQKLPARHLTLGLEGRLGAETHYYQAAEETVVEQSGSVGAFVQYNPGPFSVRLNVDGLGGSTAHSDAYYAGTRGDGYVDHVLHGTTSGTTVGLSLTKALDG